MYRSSRRASVRTRTERCDWPTQATLGVDDDYRVGELTEESGQNLLIRHFRRRNGILEAGNVHELYIGVKGK